MNHLLARVVCSIRSPGKTFSVSTTPGQSEQGSNVNDVLNISQKIQALSLDIWWFNVISRTLFGISYLSAQMQTVYSTAQASWAVIIFL